ncbi:hypothetical protein FVP43_10335 [Lactococcus sp. dk322]|nr:hypothetical protein FVP43_10335 [Lactococcus sp. dk322]
MKKALTLGLTLLASTAILTACTADKSNSTSDSSDTKQSMSTKTSTLLAGGEIVGNFNSDDKSVVGATKPGDEVKFFVSANEDTEYLHFALMHANSGDKGWYFTPKSEDGIKLSKSEIKEGEVNITDMIALYSAPSASMVKEVSADDGKLKYGEASKFVTATVKMTDNVYEVTIKNISSGDYETALSSGVWGISKDKMKAFDHTPSEGLNELATMGHRDALYKVVLSEE